MNIYKVRVFVTPKEFASKISAIEVEETAKSYVAAGKRIGKEKLMKIDTNWIEDHTRIHYHTYCLEGDQQAAIDILKAHVLEKVGQYKAELNEIIASIDRGFEKGGGNG